MVYGRIAFEGAVQHSLREKHLAQVGNSTSGAGKQMVPAASARRGEVVAGLVSQARNLVPNAFPGPSVAELEGQVGAVAPTWSWPKRDLKSR